MQGVNFKKVVTNTNLNSSRVRLNLAPTDRLNLTLDYYHLWADVPLATGQSSYGNEIDLIVRWSLTERLFLLGVAGQAWPGNLIQTRAQGTARPWTTAQVSLFWGF